MKKGLILLGVLTLFVTTSCKEDATKKIKAENVKIAAERDAKTSVLPIMTFEKLEHDFGEIDARTKVETVFKFKNTGKAPLVIVKAESSCGCTVPEYPNDPIPPGETGELLVKFNGTGTNQVQKTVTITTNTEKGKELIKIKAFVKPAANANTPKTK